MRRLAQAARADALDGCRHLMRSRAREAFRPGRGRGQSSRWRPSPPPPSSCASTIWRRTPGGLYGDEGRRRIGRLAAAPPARLPCRLLRLVHQRRRPRGALRLRRGRRLQLRRGDCRGAAGNRGPVRGRGRAGDRPPGAALGIWTASWPSACGRRGSLWLVGRGAATACARDRALFGALALIALPSMGHEAGPRTGSLAGAVPRSRPCTRISRSSCCRLLVGAVAAGGCVAPIAPPTSGCVPAAVPFAGGVRPGAAPLLAVAVTDPTNYSAGRRRPAP